MPYTTHLQQVLAYLKQGNKILPPAPGQPTAPTQTAIPASPVVKPAPPQPKAK